MQTIVYVHGAGRQEPPERVKAELDQALGRDPDSTILAHYSRVQWPMDPTESVDDEALIRSLADREVPPEAAARTLAGTLESAGSQADPELVDLIADLYRAADRTAAKDTGSEEVWDPAFRIAVGFIGKDVAAYLFEGRAAAMQAPVRAVLEPLVGRRCVVVAHSLGSIVAYDLLSAIPGLQVTRLLTAGSPLGIPNVQDRLRARAGRPNPVPPSVERWANVYDSLDPVSFLKKRISTSFKQPNMIDDRPPVDNVREANHALVGYLELPSVHKLLETD